MKRKRILSALTALCLLLGMLALPAGAANPGGVEYLNTHVNTGNQREDILAVAFTQLGYMEKVENDTRYGDWLGYPYQPWCASFVSWCARQADISTDILKSSPRANPGVYDIKYYHGSKYTPKPGDLFFTEKFTHVGIVWYVEGDFFYCIEGNAKHHEYDVPDDPTVDSYYVMTNKRLISKHYFGVPEYEGTEGDHSYVKGTDSAHPHKTYYRCSDCGDKYYTGYTAIKAGCSQCLTCGCSPEGAGYYLITTTMKPLRIRAGHSTSVNTSGYVADGAAVYVHGICDDGWACIEYDGRVGHVRTKYLKKYQDIPASPRLTTAEATYILGDDVTVKWNTPAGTEQFRLKVFRDGALYAEQVMDMNGTITLGDVLGGEYEVQVIACNRAGASAPGVLKFTVLDTYTLNYVAGGSTGAPEPQTQGMGEAAIISDVIPRRSGYTFLGWAQPGRDDRYYPGDSLMAYHDLTLYAVWRSGTATLIDMIIGQVPGRTTYLKGEPLDPTGLALELTYSDGASQMVTAGYTVEGYDPGTYGEQTVTVTYGTRTADFLVQVVPWLPGDIDLDQTVDRDDVIGLMDHIAAPDEHPITVPADFNGDGAVDQDDVTQLMWHISFPDKFPLAGEWPDQVPAAPEAPTESEEPAEPEVPTEPEAPTEPEVPTEPEMPTEPEVPTEPEMPTEPEAPAEPELPTIPEAVTEPETAAAPEEPALPEEPTESGIAAAPETDGEGD